MISKRFVIQNERGIHLRPAMALVEATSKSKCSVTVKRWGETFGASGVLRFVAAQIVEGEEIEIVCDGEDEVETMTAIEKLINSGFSEILSEVEL